MRQLFFRFDDDLGHLNRKKVDRKNFLQPGLSRMTNRFQPIELSKAEMSDRCGLGMTDLQKRHLPDKILLLKGLLKPAETLQR